MARRRHIEVASAGIDEALQLIGGDPYNGISAAGLRVPFEPTREMQRRYLFNLASFSIGDGARVRIRGFRQGWSLGAKIGGVGGAAPRFVEQIVQQPNFKLPDGNVAWGFRIIGPGEIPKRPGADIGPMSPALRDLSWRMSDAPAMLYERYDAAPASPFYVNNTGYKPPNLGRFWGTPLQLNLGTFADLRTKWTASGAWHSLNVPIDGPATVTFMSSVRQTDPLTRALLVPPTPFFPEGLSAEEQFLLNFPSAIVWRVFGALIYELDR